MFGWDKKRETESLVRLFSDGKMKPLLRYLSKEIVRADKVMETSLDHISLIRAQERKNTLKEIMRLGKRSRKSLRK